MCVCVCVHKFLDQFIHWQTSRLFAYLGYRWIIAAVNMGIKYLFKVIALFLLDIYPELRLLDQMVVLFLISWRIFILFSIVAILVYTPSNCIQEFLFPCPHQHLSFLTAIPTVRRWYLTVALISISWICNVGHLSHTNWPFAYLLWKNVYSDPLYILKIGLFGFVFFCMSSFYILDFNPLLAM